MAKLLEWSFDEASGVVVDHSGNGRDLTLSGTTARVTGHTGSGLAMTSTSEAFTGGLAIPTQPLVRTIMCWVKDTSAPTDGRALEWYDSTTDTSIFRFGFRAQWHVQVTNASTFGRVTINRPTDSLWHHLAATYDGTTIRLYLDGTLQPTTAFAGPMLTNANAFRTLVTTGSGISIDDCRAYDTVLTGAEITTLMSTPAGAVANSGTLSGSFSAATASFTGATVPADPGALTGSFSSPTAAIAANGIARGLLTGSFSSPSAAIAVTATAEVTVDGTFAVPVTAFDGKSTAGGALSGSFSTPAVTLAGAANPAQPGTLNADFSGPTVTFVGTASASALLAGTFSSPAFSASGGEPQVDRDILITIGPGTRPDTSIEVGPVRTIVTQGATQRSQIGAGHMNGTWRKGSKEYVDFVVSLKDPDDEMTLSDVQAFPFWVLVQTGAATPDRDDEGWVSKDPEVTVVDDTFAVELLHLYEAVGTGFHTVWVKFGPTPEEPIYQAASFVVL